MLRTLFPEHLSQNISKKMKNPDQIVSKTLNVDGSFMFFLWMIIAFVLLSSESFGKDTSVPPFEPKIAYSARVFVDVDMEDAKVVTKLWSNMIAAKRGGKAETFIYDNLTDLGKDASDGKIDLAGLVSNEFIELRVKAPLEPVMVTARSKTFYEELLLLVRRDSGIKEIRELQKKQFIIHQGQYALVHLTWLETLLMKEGVQNLQYFFSHIKEAKKPSQAALPVFFRQADACILTRHGFEVMCEMNPQLGAGLVPLARSQRILGGVIALRKDYYTDHKETLKDILKTLHNDSQGRQLLMLFKMEQIVPFKEEYLHSMEALFKEHKELKMRMVKAK